MKIPKMFIPNKDLESKIRELIKESKNHHFGNTTESDYNELDCRIIYNRAKEVAEKFGKLDIISSVYSFEDKETGMVIEYYPRYKDKTTHLRIYDKSQKYIIFKADKCSKEIKEVLHIPGEWQNCLEQLYKDAQKT